MAEARDWDGKERRGRAAARRKKPKPSNVVADAEWYRKAVFYEVAGNRVIVHAILSDRESDHFIRRRLGF